MSSSEFAPNGRNACSLLYFVTRWLRNAPECSFHMRGDVWVVEFWLKVLNECLGYLFQSYVLAGGACSGCLKVVYGARSLQLTNALPWLAVFAAWPQAHEQHDAAEFSAHFLHLARPRAFSGTWTARLAQGDTVRVTDTGTLLLSYSL